MRLAISGSSNCGKTTLAADLAKALKIEVIPEFLGAPFEAGPHLTPVQEMQRFSAIALAKSEQEEAMPDGFVSDRCPVDLAYSWLIRGLSLKFADESHEFFSNCQERSQNYDAVIFPPGPAPELGSPNFFGRPDRVWEMWRNHSAIIGLAFQWLPANKVFVIPQHMRTSEQRVTWVLENCVVA